MNGGGDHAADERRGNRFHYIRADAALPQNRNKTCEHHAYGHEFRPETMHGAFDDCLLNVFMLQRFAGCEPAVQCFVEVYDHDDTGFHRDPKQGDVTDPHGHAEVVAQQLLQDEATGECIECRENEHCRFRDRMKHHVEEHEDHKENVRQDDLQPL